MSERERLIKLLEDAFFEALSQCKGEDCDKKACVFLADHLLENGVIVPPVKVGDIVYIKGEALEISFIHIEKEIYYCIQFDCEECCACPFYEDEVSWEGEHDCRTNGYLEFTANDIGKTVFLTREEAEKALAERNGKK